MHVFRIPFASLLFASSAFATPTITKLVLINADTSTAVTTSSGSALALTNGMTLDLAKLPTRHLSVQGFLSDGSRIKFYWDGALTSDESYAPLAMFGDSGSKFNSWTPKVGSHTIKAIPYRSSTAGSSYSVALNVIDTPPSVATPTITKLVLMNADTNAPVTNSDGTSLTIANGMTLDLAKLPTRHLSVQGYVSNGSRIQFYLDGKLTSDESYAPLAMFGDVSSKFNPWTPSVGSHAVKAIPMSGSTAGTAFSALINVVDAPVAIEPDPVSPPSTETGWTQPARSSDTRVIYVSSSTGSDSNNGLSSDRPVKTASKAASLVRDGYPDWILFKRGDTFYGGPSVKNGRSATEPFLVGAYGEGDRPEFLIDYGKSPVNGCGKNKFFLSLHFHARQRDPNMSSFTMNAAAPMDDGVRCVWGTVANIRWEDNLFEYFALPIYYNGEQGSHTNIRLYRNVIKNSWAAGSGVRNRKSQGMFMTDIHGLTIEENIFYMNGWNPSITGATRSYLNHNAYLTNITDLVLRGNISAASSSLGFKLNSTKVGGVTNALIENNFVIGASNGISVWCNDRIARAFKNVKVRNNVHTHIGARADTDSGTNQEQALGMRLWHVENLEATGNIFVDKDYVSMSQTALDAGTLAGTVAFSNNVVFDYVKGGAPASSMVSTSSNWLERSASELVDPSRTIDTYMKSSDGEAALYREIVKQRKGDWNDSLTAKAINAYFRAGITKR